MAEQKNKKQDRKPKTDPDQFYKRVLHRAWMRGAEGIIYQGEALALALLLHARGKQRSKGELEQISKMMDDPNLEK